MAYVPGFQYDVFISYRQADNKFGWVRLLDETLRAMLDEHQRPKKDEPPWRFEIFRDDRELPGNQPLTAAINEAVRGSAVLAIVMSDNYLAEDSDWCHRERTAFLQACREAAGAGGRIFVVRKDSVHETRWPAELQQLVGYQFWEVDERGTEQELSFDFTKSGRPPVACQRFGNAVFKTLQELRRSSLVTSAAPGAVPASIAATPSAVSPGPEAASLGAAGSRPLIFLSEVTDALYEDRAQFLSFLEQEGFRVAPGEQQQYRFQPTAALAELPPQLNEAILVVQLHDQTPIPSNKEYGTRFEAWLAEQARQAGKTPGQSLLRWRRQGLKQEDVADQTHRGLVFQPDVIAEDLGNFRHLVVRAARELIRQRSMPVTAVKAKVMVTTQDKPTHQPLNDEVVNEIEGEGSELVRQPLRSAMVYDDRVHEAAKILERQQAPPKAMVVVHADGDELWVQERMDECREYALSKKPKSPPCAVVVKPPDAQTDVQVVPPAKFDVIAHDDKQRFLAFLAKLAPEAVR